MSTFRAWRVHQNGDRIAGAVESLPLPVPGEGEVLIRAEWSGINYKDALGATGAGKILRRFPLTAGIDVAGTVAESRHPDWRVGQPVLVNGCGLGENHDGGFAECVCVPGDWVVALPEGLSTRDAMILGTAGFTAALALTRMEALGQTPEQGPVLVTGASGGVGNFAVQCLKRAGYTVHAVSGKPEAADWLQRLGADEVTTPEALRLGHRPLEKARWAGAVDSVGGELLVGICRHVDLFGNVAAIGLAGGARLETTVMPHILRGVSLLGISSANCPQPLRRQVWARLGEALRPRHLDEVVDRVLPLEQLQGGFEDLLERRVRGRILVDLASPGRPDNQ